MQWINMRKTFYNIKNEKIKIYDYKNKNSKKYYFDSFIHFTIP
jgi:hypothetical protein